MATARATTRRKGNAAKASAALERLQQPSLVDRLVSAVARSAYHGAAGEASVGMLGEIPTPAELPYGRLHLWVVCRGRVLVVNSRQRAEGRGQLKVFAGDDSPAADLQPPASRLPPDLDVVQIDLAYQFRCEATKPAGERLVAWQSMIELAIDVLRSVSANTGGLAAVPEARLTNVDQTPLYDRDHLRRFRTLTSVLKCSYVIPRDPPVET